MSGPLYEAWLLGQQWKRSTNRDVAMCGADLLQVLGIEGGMAQPDAEPGSPSWNRMGMSARYEQMLELAGSSMAFEIERTEARQADSPEQTFSAVAVDQMLIDMRTWVFSRLWRFWRETNHSRGAQKMVAIMTVELE
jgi:hypothetical protein